jgi:hypothetical protein
VEWLHLFVFFVPFVLADLLSKEVRQLFLTFGKLLEDTTTYVLNPLNLDRLQVRIIEWLCLAELYLPDTELIASLHWWVHLVGRGLRVWGPVHAYWAFPFERCLFLRLFYPHFDNIQHIVLFVLGFFTFYFLVSTIEDTQKAIFYLDMASGVLY